MDIEKQRESFEAWFESRYGANFMQFALDLDLYVDKHTQTCWEAWQAAKAQAVPDGFVLIKDDTKTVVAIERMVEQQVEASGMDSRRLERLDGWKIIEAAVKAQEQSNNVAPELVNNDVTYVIELQGYEAIEHARVTLKKKGYKTWDYTDKDSIDDADIYVLCVCPSTPNDSALVKGTFKGIHQGKFTYIQSDLESCPDTQEKMK